VTKQSQENALTNVHAFFIYNPGDIDRYVLHGLESVAGHSSPGYTSMHAFGGSVRSSAVASRVP